MNDVYWLTAKDVLRVNAGKWPNKIGAKDLYKSYTFKEWNERSCRLANALSSMGMKKGDRFAALGYNCVEWMEIYAAAAKGGFIVVPIMFRLSAPEMEYNINHSECKVFLVQGGTDGRTGKEFPWIEMAKGMKKNLPTVTTYVSYAIDNPHYDGFASYEDALASASSLEPAVKVDGEDIWIIMYTSGTTGRPKGVMKSHRSLFAQYFIMIYDHVFGFDDTTLLVMPCCHINSLNYSFVNTWVGGTVMAYNMVSFDAEDLLKTFSDHKITFTSLVPTHYIMMLSLPDEVKKKYDLSSIKKLLISSAPARKDTKLGILKTFPNSKLDECYGSTEAGCVTILKPEEQLTKLGSCGREVIGSDLLELYDEEGHLITEPTQSRGGLLPEPHAPLRLLEGAGETGRCDERRILLRRRHGLQGRGGLPLPRRPEGEHDHLRGREHLPLRGRERRGRLSESQRRGGHRHSPREVGGDHPRHRRPPRESDRHPRGHHDLLQGQDRRVQGAEERRLHQR